MLINIYNRALRLEAPASSVENTSSENLWPHPSSSSSFVLGDEDTAENFRLAQLLTNDLGFGNQQCFQTITSANQNGDRVASPGNNPTDLTPKRMRSSEPSRTIKSECERALDQIVSIGPDGLYHCPWEGEKLCNHQPPKLRCTYKYDIFLTLLFIYIR